MKQLLFSLLTFLAIAELPAQDFTSNNIDFANGGITVADFNNDSFPDIIFQQRVRFGDVKEIVVQLNNASDTLGFTKMEFVADNVLFGGGTAGDFSGDGLLDLAFSAAEEANIILFTQNTDGTLAESLLPVDGAVNLKAANLNGDEFMDMVALNIADREIVAYVNDGSTGFTRTTLYGNDLSIGDYQPADIDEDGDIDVIFGTDTFNGEAVGLLRNDGNATFTLELIESTSTEVDGVEGLSVGDINLDGRVDIAVTTSNKVYLYYQGEDLSFSRTTVPTTSFIYRSIVVGDFNGDGAGDFMTGDNSSEGIRLYTNDGMETPSFVNTEVSGILPVFSMIARDMNRDGDLDLVASNGDVYTFENMIEQLPPVSIVTPALNEVTAYPNPVADDYLLLSNIPQATNVVFELLDLNGRMVRQGKLGSNSQIDMKGIARGTYVVRLLENQVVWGSTLVVKQ